MISLDFGKGKTYFSVRLLKEKDINLMIQETKSRNNNDKNPIYNAANRPYSDTL
jgi:hypothetical protein